MSEASLIERLMDERDAARARVAELEADIEQLKADLSQRVVPYADRPACSASTYRDKSHAPYGPGDFNRCVRVEGHVEPHVDGFGQRFRLEPKFKVLGHE